jgi:hypothetical protein
MKVTATATLAAASMLVISPFTRRVLSVCGKRLAGYMKDPLMNLAHALTRALAVTRPRVLLRNTEGLIN